MSPFLLTITVLVKLVTPEVFEKHQKKSIKEAKANIKGAFHCKTPDCAGWTVIGAFSAAKFGFWRHFKVVLFVQALL